MVAVRRNAIIAVTLLAFGGLVIVPVSRAQASVNVCYTAPYVSSSSLASNNSVSASTNLATNQIALSDSFVQDIGGGSTATPYQTDWAESDGSPPTVTFGSRNDNSSSVAPLKGWLLLTYGC